MNSLIRKSKRLHAGTSAGKLDTLLEARSRWQRKQTIATNKLEQTNRALDRLAREMAEKLYEQEWSDENKQ